MDTLDPGESCTLKIQHGLIEKGPAKTITMSHHYTLTQIDSKSASEESHVCIAIASLYISLSGLSWCYLKVTGPLWKKMLIEKNLSYSNILKIKISLVKLWFSKCYHRINFFLSIFFSTVVRSPLDNIMKDHSSLCRDLQWLYRPGILQMHFLNQSESMWSRFFSHLL